VARKFKELKPAVACNHLGEEDSFPRETVSALGRQEGPEPVELAGSPAVRAVN
jgi:hypothetical protein